MFVQGGENPGRDPSRRPGHEQGALVKWSTQGEWVKKRRERQRESPQAALDILKRQRELQIKTIGTETLAAPTEIDALHKLTQLIEKMESRIEAIGPMLDVMCRFAQFVARATPTRTPAR